jgi:hypothetical protein
VASKFSISAIYKLIDNFSKPLKGMGYNSRAFSNGIKADFARAQRSVNNFSENIKRHAWIGVTAMAAGLGLLAKEGIQLASNLNEVQNVVDVSFGKSSDTINKWSKTAIQKFGLSELQAKKFNGTMGAMLKSSGLSGESIVKMSTDLSGLAGDFASFYNLDSEEAFTKIRSGISGETEPLKQLGINMSVANLQAFALTQGIHKQFQKMTQAEQATLRYNYLMKVSADAQGDFSRTLGTSLANQQRVLQTKFGQKLAEVFQKLIPLLIEGASKFTAWLDTVDTGAIADFVVTVFNGFKSIIDAGVTLFKILKPMAPLIMTIVSAMLLYKAGMIAGAIVTGIISTATSIWRGIQFIAMVATQGLTVAQAAFNGVAIANPIGLIIVAIAALIGLIVLLIKNWDKVVAALKAAWEECVKLVGWIWKTDEGFTKFSAIISVILGPMGLLISMLMEVGRNWDNIAKKFTSGDIIGGILGIGGALISGLLAPIQGFLDLISNIPGLGDIGKGGAAKIAELRAALTGGKKEESQTPVNAAINPYERSSTSKSVSSGELVIKDQTGRAEMQNVKGSPGYTIKLQTSGGFSGGAH